MMDHQDQPNLLNNLPGMVYRCHHDTQRSVLFASEGCLALTGYTAAELTDDPGLVYGDLIHPEDRQAVQQEIESAIEERRPYHNVYRLLTADQQERWVWDSGRGIFTENGDLLALEGFVTDASEQALSFRRMQQQVADQARKLSALHGILEAVRKPEELPIILRKSLKAALVAVQGDAGFIHLREKTGKHMHLVARQGVPKEAFEKLATVSTRDGLVAWVARNREPLLIPNIDEDPRTVYLSASSDLKVYVGVPVARGQQVWGTLSILGNNLNQFGSDEVALLSSVGEEIGIVVENARLRRQTERLLVVQERNRLARELHDSVTQSLYSITLFAEAGSRTVTTGKTEEIAASFNQIGEIGQQALKEMRLLVHKLRPSILAKEGLVRALQQRLNSVEGRAGVKSQLIVEGKVQLAPSLEDALFHIAQEALNNALKHAMASEVIVRLDFLDDNQVMLRVEDNGRGFDPETTAVSDGLGITSMQERAEIFDGTIGIQSSPGQGCIVEARLKEVTATARPSRDFDVEDLP